MNLTRSIEMLKMAGIKALPVPGTSKYHITFPDGNVIVIKEGKLIKLADQVGNNPADLKRAIESAV